MTVPPVDAPASLPESIHWRRLHNRSAVDALRRLVSALVEDDLPTVVLLDRDYGMVAYPQVLAVSPSELTARYRATIPDELFVYLPHAATSS